ncbi:transposase [Flavobacterium salmonis]|uniref:transposase n=1 Tax=Flavobacterium salmonis TaxID=2654844 RepID=UPI0036081AB0
MSGNSIELITNQFHWSPNAIGELYKSRWKVEIFFREIKQLLHIKSFIGTSKNVVMIQIWTTLITILILKALKAQSKFDWYLCSSFYTFESFVKIDLQNG